MGKIGHIVLDKYPIHDLSTYIEDCNKDKSERYGAILYTCKDDSSIYANTTPLAPRSAVPGKNIK